MAMYSYGLNGMEEAMLRGLDSHIKAALKNRFDEVAKDVINEAVKEAIKTFETSIKTYRDGWKQGDIIEVLLVDKRGTK